MKENPSILRQITQYLLPIHENAKPTHLFLAKDPPRVRKAVAIGVHGLFPASYLRPMIGQPTGTSIRFANHAAEATRRWADSHGYGDCEIEKIALEGEGKIADRVDNLWKLMLNWIDHIRGADLVVLACHSQGVPVGFMLLAKLIDLGIVTTARIGVCAMGKSFCARLLFMLYMLTMKPVFHSGRSLTTSPVSASSWALPASSGISATRRARFRSAMRMLSRRHWTMACESRLSAASMTKLFPWR